MGASEVCGWAWVHRPPKPGRVRAAPACSLCPSHSRLGPIGSPDRSEGVLAGRWFGLLVADQVDPGGCVLAGPPERGVGAAGGEEVGVGAGLDDVAAVEHVDGVGLADGG